MSKSMPDEPPALDLERCALFLDYDGTLVPIAPTPDAAHADDALRRLLEAAAAKSSPVAHRRLGAIRFHGLFGAQPDRAAALRHFSSAADAGCVDSAADAMCATTIAYANRIRVKTRCMPTPKWPRA